MQTAYKSTFCNRVLEREHLKKNIAKGKHTVIVAPRRYGKTSLACQVLSEIEGTYAEIDLFCAVSAKSICDKIAKGVSVLIRQILPFTEKTMHLLGACFKSSVISVVAGQLEIKVEFAKPAINPVDEMVNLLSGLEQIAKKQKKRIVLFLDEFQDLLKVDQSSEIQAAIRSVAQKAEYLMFIFSGSSRHMLKKIFDDRGQPLYMLCDKIDLKRIGADHFKAHIQKAAQKKWANEIPADMAQHILTITELHPYYVNLLCDKLWDNDDMPTTIETVEAVWNECLIGYKDKLIADLEPLNTNKMKVLNGFALLDKVREPNSKYFLDTVGLSLGSAQKAIAYLMQHDYIYKTEARDVMLVDPLLKKFITGKIEYV
ncbi:MAG: hypothetical protein KAT71_02215 [Gammaproteobacteria bacterium]|nr:hypothetical protein [Gammaproteobacteria bacterium]